MPIHPLGTDRVGTQAIICPTHRMSLDVGAFIVLLVQIIDCSLSCKIEGFCFCMTHAWTLFEHFRAPSPHLHACARDYKISSLTSLQTNCFISEYFLSSCLHIEFLPLPSISHW